MERIIPMSTKEIERVEVLAQVKEKTISQKEAAESPYSFSNKARIFSAAPAWVVGSWRFATTTSLRPFFTALFNESTAFVTLLSLFSGGIDDPSDCAGSCCNCSWDALCRNLEPCFAWKSMVMSRKFSKSFLPHAVEMLSG